MDGKHEGRGQVPGGGEGYIIGGKIVKRQKPSEKLEDLASFLFDSSENQEHSDQISSEAKILFNKGMKLTEGRPLWEKGGLIDTAEGIIKNGGRLELNALLSGAAHARALEVLMIGRDYGMIPSEIVRDREAVDKGYLLGVLKDREKNPNKVSYRFISDQMKIPDLLKLLGDLTSEQRSALIQTTAETQARRNLGVDIHHPIEEDLLYERIDSEKEYLEQALEMRKSAMQSTYRQNA